MEGQRRGGRPIPQSGTGPGRVPPGPPPPPHPHPAAKSAPRAKAVDREKICPMLLRVYTKVGGHHSDDEFSVRGKEPKGEVQIYTWMDATLREITDLLKEVDENARRRDARLSFAFGSPTKNGRFTLRKVGTTPSVPNSRRLDDGYRALCDLNFEIGDYLDVAIMY